MTSASYKSPFESRYASREMLALFSDDFRYKSWRRLWVALARAESELGLDIQEAQIAELEANIDYIDYKKAAAYEKQSRHEVIAQIKAYGDVCPKAKAIIHLGATSCFVMDNGELLQLRAALDLIEAKLRRVMENLADFAQQYRDLPCLGYTHFQAAQLTTVGKRACLWLQDLLMDLQDLRQRKEELRFLGVKGATGTQASFLALFDGDFEKVQALDRRVAELAGFDKLFTIAAQTYTRKQDIHILDALAGIAVSAHKMTTDIRLLCHLKEIEEPWGSEQVGSSAMAYKRNPMRSERVCSIARFIISLAENPKYTAATQWLERSLDDSANRRLCLSESCLATDSILNILIELTKGLIVNPSIIQRNIDQELPFIATENLLMTAVKKGYDRQQLHECIRRHSQQLQERMKAEGASNTLLTALAEDAAFPLDAQEIHRVVNVLDFVGCAPQQVEQFLTYELQPILKTQGVYNFEEAPLAV